MIATNSIKILAVFTLAGAMAAGCSRRSAPDESAQRPVIGPSGSRIPFAAREPDVFQAEIVVTGNDSVRITRIARSGAKRRIETDADRASKLVLVIADKQVLFLPVAGKCAELPVGSAFADAETEGFLTTRWLSERADAQFEKLETRDGLGIFRARFGEDGSSEATLAVDEARGLVMKQEFVSVEDGIPQTTMTVEVRDFKPTAEEVLFAVPADCRKTEPAELIRQKQELDNEK